MAPLLALVVSFLLFLGLGRAGVALFADWQSSLRFALSAMFLLTASAHFTRTREDLVRMVPRRFQRPDLLVKLTGILELAGALGLIIPATAQLASIGLLLLLLAIFPANVHAARAGLTLRGKPVLPLLIRTGLQLLFAVAVAAAGWPLRRA
jgi:uncharacterized membrane protein